MGPPVVWVLARGLLRRRLWASIALATFAGLAAAAPMAVWAAGRQTATAVDRSLERAGAADAGVIACPPGFDPTGPSGPEPCFEYQPERELDVIRSLPGVTQAARASFTNVRVGASPDPATWRLRPLATLNDPVRAPTMLGQPKVVAGRLAAEDAPDEVMVVEAMARALGVGPGDRVWMQGADAGEGAGATPPVVSTVAGIVRTPADLLPLEEISLGGLPLHVRAGWSQAHAAELRHGATAIFVWLADGDREGFTARLEALLGDQAVVVSPALDEGQRSNLEQATAFESRAALAVAAAAGLAVAFFLGQAVSRQARAESSDVPTLLALGMTRRQLAAAAAARWLPIALAGAVLAMAGALAASGLGPVGVARRATWDPGLHADWLVLVTGGAVAATLVLGSGVAALYRHRDRGEATAGSVPAALALGSPGVRAGVALARRSLRRGGALPVVSALVGTTVAVAAVIAASGGAASVRRVVASPERFGAPWDALVAGAPDRQHQDELLARLAGVPGVSTAAAIPGNTVMIGDQEHWVQAMAPIQGIGPLRPVITAGREPVADDEIALGAITMRQLGLDVGDQVPVQSQLSGSEPRPYRVVGVTMITDGYEPNVGEGGIVTLPGLERVAPETTVDAEVDVVVRVADEPGRAAALAALGDAFPDARIPFPVPSSLANAERIAGLPVALGIAAAAVAAVTFTHALVVTVRRNRRELAVCRVLGFTRAQVYGAVATHATLIAMVASAAGVLLGVLGARWGWRTLAASFGVASGPVLPAWATFVSVGAVLAVSNLVAAVPGRKAANLRAADVLRDE